MFRLKMPIWLRKIGFVLPFKWLWNHPGDLYERTWTPGYLVYRRVKGPLFRLVLKAPSRQVLRSYKRKVTL